MDKRGTSLHLKAYENEAEQLSRYSSGYVSMNCSPPAHYRSYSKDSYRMTSCILGSNYDTGNLINLFIIIAGKVLHVSICLTIRSSICLSVHSSIHHSLFTMTLVLMYIVHIHYDLNVIHNFIIANIFGDLTKVYNNHNTLFS